MIDVFKNMSDDEFLYQVCAFLGKDNFTRLANIVGSKCPSEDGCIGGSDCGECFYKFLREYEKHNKII